MFAMGTFSFCVGGRLTFWSRPAGRFCSKLVPDLLAVFTGAKDRLMI